MRSIQNSVGIKLKFLMSRKFWNFSYFMDSVGYAHTGPPMKLQQKLTSAIFEAELIRHHCSGGGIKNACALNCLPCLNECFKNLDDMLRFSPIALNSDSRTLLIFINFFNQ